MRNIKPKVQHFEEPTSYLYDSINTRVPPMNISGKKSPPILSKIQWESPNTLMHSRSYQNFPLEKGMLRRESPQPNYRNYYEPERIERIERPNGQTMRHEYPFFEPQMPQPAIRSSRPAIYRPALANLSNKAVFPDRQMNLNPFEVVEQLFLEENSIFFSLFGNKKNILDRNEKEFMNSAKHEVNTVEKGTDPIEPFKETKVQIVEDEKLMKNFVEVFPTVPNEDVHSFIKMMLILTKN
jgi:hypothetical protein